MRRKLIKQGGTGVTAYLPKQWIDQQRLKAGDEIEITILDAFLTIAPCPEKNKKKEIVIPFKKGRESALRTMILNAYRAGFDKIIVQFEGKQQELRHLTDSFLLGFELFHVKDTTYALESMSEPSYENFEGITRKQFYLLRQILDSLFQEQLEDLVYRLQKYDNFLKRCLSKQLFTIEGRGFFWQFLSYLSQIARCFLHFHRDILEKKARNIEKDKDISQCLDVLKEMIDTLEHAYVKKEYLILQELHLLDERIQKEYKWKILKEKNAWVGHHILLIARLLYVTNSPLMGVLQLEQLRKTKT